MHQRYVSDKHGFSKIYKPQGIIYEMYRSIYFLKKSFHIHLIGHPNESFIASISAQCHISCLKHQDRASYLVSATGCLKGVGSNG